MAACTAYTNIIVSEAGTTAVNGTYIPYSTGTRGAGCKAGESFTIWTKDGLNSYPRIEVVGSGSGTWQIGLGAPPFPGAPAYVTGADSFCNTDCPAVGLTWSVGTFGTGDVPTVTGTPAGPNCADPLERCAFATGTESGRSRFRRLVALGYV